MTIAKYTQESKHLHQLDLSWCSDVQRKTWTYFLSKLKGNRVLQYLNISFNEIIEIDEKNGNQALKDLTQFIKKSKSLIHIDLTNCGLKKHQIMAIAHILRRSEQVRAVHLSFNPGVDEELIGFLRKQCNSKKDEMPIVLALPFKNSI